jgi:hypothetical protein
MSPEDSMAEQQGVDSIASILDDLDHQTPEQVVMRFWLNWFSNEARVEPGETLDQAHERLLGAMSIFVDEEETGVAAQKLEAVVSAHEGPFVGLLRSAFRQACSRTHGKLGDRALRAHLLFVPIIARSQADGVLPTEISPEAADALRRDLHERLDAEGRNGDAIIPVTAIFSVNEMDMFRPVAFYGLLRHAFRLGGIGQQFFPQFEAPHLREVLPPMLVWGERHETFDPAAFLEMPIESAPAVSRAQPLSFHLAQVGRVVTGRYLTLVWVSDATEKQSKLPNAFSDQAWHSHASSLLAKEVLASVAQTSVRQVAAISSGPTDSILNANLSLAVLGASEPVAASLKLRQELIFSRVVSAARSRISMLDAQNHWKDEPSQASIVYDPKREQMMLVLDGDFQNPNITFEAANSVWVYPMMSKLAQQLEAAGCEQVHTKVLDHSIQSDMDLKSYSHVH